MSKAADVGFTSYWDNNGGWMDGNKTGNCVPIVRNDALYVMQMWVWGAQSELPKIETPFAKQG